jgi:hypothetical protein
VFCALFELDTRSPLRRAAILGRESDHASDRYDLGEANL